MRRRALQLGGLALGVIASARLPGSYPTARLSMTCAQFASLEVGVQLRVMAWMDGYSEKWVHPAAQGQLVRVVRGCQHAPDAPVRDQIARVRTRPPSS